MEPDLLAARFQACVQSLKTPAQDSGLAELRADGQGTWWMGGGGSTRWGVGWLRSRLPVLCLVLAPLLECQDLVQRKKCTPRVIKWKPAIVMNVSSEKKVKRPEPAFFCMVQNTVCVCGVQQGPSLPLQHGA